MPVSSCCVPTGLQSLCHLQVVNRYIDQGIAELVPGVLFIDEVRRVLAAVNIVRQSLRWLCKGRMWLWQLAVDSCHLSGF